MFDSLSDFILGICIGYLIFVLVFFIDDELNQCNCKDKNCIVVDNIQYCEN